MEVIGSNAEHVTKLFRSCLKGLHKRSYPAPEHNHRTALTDLDGRFQSWCGHFGVTQRGMSPPTARICERFGICQSVSSFTQDLKGELEQCKRLED
jgi:hypothetical protein